MILFLVLASIFGYLLVTRNIENDTSLLVADRQFAVEETENIHKIFIVDRRGNETLLTRANGTWRYNNQYKARENAIDNLLDAVSRIQVKYKPPEAALSNMIKELSSEGIKVELYGKTGKLLKAYYIGGGTADERGTHAIMEGAEQPYVTHIPGWEGNLRFRFNLTGDDWRDKTLLDFQPEEIASVSVEYPKQRNRSFHLFNQNGRYSVIPFYEITPEINQPVDQGRAEAYLTNFESIVAEAFENENPIKDSILQLVPFSVIKVKTQRGLETELRLFPVIPRGVTIDPKTGLQQNAQIERFFVEYNNNDFMLAQNRVVKEILWGYDFFFDTEKR